MALWGGRFEGDTDPLFKQFNDSLPYDWRLVQQDISGSIAWAHGLEKAGVLSNTETRQLISALKKIATLAADDPKAVANAGDEDVHSWVERQLIERLGDVGKKLHTGRSRNDQVATDLRLWVRNELTERQREILDAQDSLLALAHKYKEVVFPGFTHLQRAQPILFSHWCLAYYEMLERDRQRFADADKRVAICPLGCGALAGTAFDIDREAIAHELHFDGPAQNSIDAVSDRDFLVETLAASVLCGLHLSRLAEDLVFYASSEAGFVQLDDTTTTGSSMMPQKKNPDALELIRGKSGRLLGSLVSMCVTLKGLPTAYNKDLQEDKQSIFDSMDTLSMCQRVVRIVLDRLIVCEELTKEAAQGGYTNATDLADCLVDQKVPFRQAHEQVGLIVRQAIKLKINIEDLPTTVVKELAPAIGDDYRSKLTIDASLNRRNALGGTSPVQVAAAMNIAANNLATHRNQLSASEVRIRQARIDDIDGICELVDYWAKAGENLPRSRDDILEGIQDFAVAVDSDKVVGCGSLYVYTHILAEIRSLGVATSHHGSGVGSKLVEHFVRRATRLHIPRVFVLTRTPKFFGRLGFCQQEMDVLPEKVFKDCVNCPKIDCCDEIPMVYETSV